MGKLIDAYRDAFDNPELPPIESEIDNLTRSYRRLVALEVAGETTSPDVGVLRETLGHMGLSVADFERSVLAVAEIRKAIKEATGINDDGIDREKIRQHEKDVTRLRDDLEKAERKLAHAIASAKMRASAKSLLQTYRMGHPMLFDGAELAPELFVAGKPAKA